MLEAGMRQRWRMRQPPDPDDFRNRSQQLAARLVVAPLTAQLLLLRGIGDPLAAERFLQPKLTHLDDPQIIPGMANAATRLVRAVAEKQPIVIYGDYDVDGVTASAILWHMLRQAGGDASIYIPHRIDEGYGLNCEAIAKLAAPEDGRKPLIVTVDCGITAREPAATARQAGVDLIITDHHQFDPANLPDAFALVHPALDNEAAANETSPLCGAGVAWKLAWAIAREHCGSERLPEAFRELLLDLLAFAALGTIADVVPLVGENRVITVHGLGRIKHTRFAGLNALINASRLSDEKIDSYAVGFRLAPRLNAAGRLGHARDAAKLFTFADPRETASIAEYLTCENERRRNTERTIYKQAEALVLERGDNSDDRRALVVGSEGWHPGVIGIVASRLVERFHRPVVMLSVDNGCATGSARSVPGVSIHEALCACSEHLQTFGGHAMAAGLRLETDRIDAFRDALVEYVNAVLSPDDLASHVDVDMEVELRDCGIEAFDEIHRLEPFGQGNLPVRLLLRGAVVDRPPALMGTSGRHMALQLRQRGAMMRAVAFNMGQHAEQLPAGSKVDIVFEPRVSTWRDLRRPEMHIRDFHLNESC